MKIRVNRRMIGSILVLFLFCTSADLVEEKLPAKPINLFVGFSPGGSR